MGVFDYKRRYSTVARVGNVPVGGTNPIALQSMTNTSTMDVEGSVAQCRRIADAGAHIVRLTAQGVREAESIGRIRELLHGQGVDIPLVADIHFNPRAAFASAEVTDKVRINPGNFVDPVGSPTPTRNISRRLTESNRLLCLFWKCAVGMEPPYA